MRPSGGVLRWLLGSGAALAGILVWSQPAHAALHRAALVVEHSTGRLVARCVSFSENQISGFELIQRSGIEYRAQAFAGLGPAICQLDQEPNPSAPGCLGTGPYWQYFHRTGSGWAQSMTGAGSAVLHDGDMDGWHYASGAGQIPPPVTFAQVCPPAPTRQPVAAGTAPPTGIPPARGPQALLPTVAPPPSIATASAPPRLITLPDAQPRTATSSTSALSPSPPIILLGLSMAGLLGLAVWNLVSRRAP